MFWHFFWGSKTGVDETGSDGDWPAPYFSKTTVFATFFKHCFKRIQKTQWFFMLLELEGDRQSPLLNITRQMVTDFGSDSGTLWNWLVRARAAPKMVRIWFSMWHARRDHASILVSPCARWPAIAIPFEFRVEMKQPALARKKSVWALRAQKVNSTTFRGLVVFAAKP